MDRTIELENDMVAAESFQSYLREIFQFMGGYFSYYKLFPETYQKLLLIMWSNKRERELLEELFEFQKENENLGYTDIQFTKLQYIIEELENCYEGENANI